MNPSLKHMRSALLVVVVAALAACSTTSTTSTQHTPSATADAAASTAQTVDVFAAASLTDVFTELAAAYEADHPGISIDLTFGGSSDLATQIVEGAPADVFASANERQMEAVAGEVDGSSHLFATNTLTIVVPSGNPAGVTDFASLAAPGLLLVACAPEVPCGAATASLEEQLGVSLSPVSEESSVTDVLGKVAAGEADAGLVYVTDVARAEGVESIPFDGAELATNRYPIATLTTGDAQDAARDFLAYVLGPEGQAALAAAGFHTP